MVGPNLVLPGLSELPNLRNVYLPSSLRFIEQGYFHNCDKLDNVFLADGIVYKPNEQLFPERTKVVESPGTKERAIVVEEPEEKAAVFTQVLSSGERETIKIPLSHGRISKSFVRAGIPGLEELRYTRGTTNIVYEYETDEYESSLIKGGKYSEIPDLKRVVMPDGVVIVEDYLFEDCKSLEEVVLPESVKYIDRYAFCGCLKLRSINIPDSVEKIGSNAFRECTSLTRFDAPKNLREIEMNAFNGCDSLETVIFPPESGSISLGAFGRCRKLSRLQLPTERMGSISSHAFANCTSLKKVCFPKSMTDLGYEAFENCVSLESVLMPSHFRDLNQAFQSCSSLKYVAFPSTISEQMVRDLFPNNYYCNFLMARDCPKDMTSEQFLDEEVKKAKERREKEIKKEAEKAKKRREEEGRASGQNIDK